MSINGVTYKDWGWYNTYFTMIKNQPTIKQMMYINWDWDIQDMVSGNGMFPWGDARLQMPGSVKGQYFDALSDPAYLHATSEKETRAFFSYNDNTAPPQVTKVKRDGDHLIWDKVSDNGEAGLAHYTIYKNGKLWDYIIGEKYSIHDLHQAGNHAVAVNNGSSNPFIPKTHLKMNIYVHYNTKTTHIKYTIPEKDRVKIDIYNMSGKRVSKVIDLIQVPGSHSLKWNMSTLPAGIYFFKILSGNRFQVAKCVYIK